MRHTNTQKPFPIYFNCDCDSLINFYVHLQHDHVVLHPAMELGMMGCVCVCTSVEFFLFFSLLHHFSNHLSTITIPLPDNPCQHVCKLSINRSARSFITQSVPFILNHHCHFRIVFNFIYRFQDTCATKTTSSIICVAF